MKILESNYIKISFVLLLIICFTIGHRTNTGGTFSIPQGGYLFIKTYPTFQFRLHLDSVYAYHHIQPDKISDWVYSNHLDGYKHALTLKKMGYNPLIQAVSYRYHYLNFILFSLICLMLLCLLIGCYQAFKNQYFLVIVSIFYMIPIGLHYYALSLNENALHFFIQLISLFEVIVWLVCVVVCILFRNKSKFNIWLFRLQIFIIALCFALKGWDFIAHNYKNKIIVTQEAADLKAKQIEDSKIDYPAEAPTK